MIKKAFSSLLLIGALGAPVVITVRAVAQDQRQEDRDQARYVDQQGQEHRWDANEDKAYRRYLAEKHRKYEDFNHMNKQQQEEYWQWRREHPDQR